jgi:hypothetical protein
MMGLFLYSHSGHKEPVVIGSELPDSVFNGRLEIIPVTNCYAGTKRPGNPFICSRKGGVDPILVYAGNDYNDIDKQGRGSFTLNAYKVGVIHLDGPGSAGPEIVMVATDKTDFFATGAKYFSGL